MLSGDSHGRYFNYLSCDEAIDERSGQWEIVSVTEYLGGGYDSGKQGPWVAVMAKRPA